MKDGRRGGLGIPSLLCNLCRRDCHDALDLMQNLVSCHSIRRTQNTKHATIGPFFLLTSSIPPNGNGGCGRGLGVSLTRSLCRGRMPGRGIASTITFRCLRQCDQIGRFLKGIGDKFSNKSRPHVCWLFGLLWKHPFSFINCCSYFLANFWKFLCYFIIQRLDTLVAFYLYSLTR